MRTQYFKNFSGWCWLFLFEKLKKKKKVTTCSSSNDAKAEPGAFLYQAMSVSISCQYAYRGTADHKVVRFWVIDSLFFLFCFSPWTKVISNHLLF